MMFRCCCDVLVCVRYLLKLFKFLEKIKDNKALKLVPLEFITIEDKRKAKPGEPLDKIVSLFFSKYLFSNSQLKQKKSKKKCLDM